MSVPGPSRSPRGDGVKVVASGGVRKSVWLVAGACALLSLAALLLFFLAGGASAPPPPEAPKPAPRVAAAPTPDSKGEPAQRHVKPVAIAKKSESEAAPEAPPAHEDAPFSFGPPGEKTGIALFPPHGTKPIKIGIVVPEDYEVPEGYVRHYQATDDGEMLPAILLFHPDYEWVDDAGNKVELPADRVVPAEMAPPGLPIQMLEVPKKQEGAR